MKNAMRNFAAGICGAVLLLLLPSGIQGQTGSATISGQVLDARGAIAPGASIQVGNIQTGIAHRVETNAAGIYGLESALPRQIQLALKYMF
jgi:hypothetical protein